MQLRIQERDATRSSSNNNNSASSSSCSSSSCSSRTNSNDSKQQQQQHQHQQPGDDARVRNARTARELDFGSESMMDCSSSSSSSSSSSGGDSDKNHAHQLSESDLLPQLDEALADFQLAAAGQRHGATTRASPTSSSTSTSSCKPLPTLVLAPRNSKQPLILIEVDGVVNVKYIADPRYRYHQKRMSQIPDELVSSWDDMQSLWVHTLLPELITFSPSVVARINAWADKAEIVWVTTWRHIARKTFGPAVGLKDFRAFDDSKSALCSKDRFNHEFAAELSPTSDHQATATTATTATTTTTTTTATATGHSTKESEFAFRKLRLLQQLANYTCPERRELDHTMRRINGGLGSDGSVRLGGAHHGYNTSDRHQGGVSHSGTKQNTPKKASATRNIGPRPLVWIDCDLGKYGSEPGAMFRPWMSARPDTLLLAPSTLYGLTETHLDQVDDFLRKHTVGASGATSTAKEGSSNFVQTAASLSSSSSTSISLV